MNVDEQKQLNALIYSNINVTENNPLKELGKIIVQLALFLVIIYCFIFYGSGIIINVMPVEKQIALENLISKTQKVETIQLPQNEINRFDIIKRNILEVDKKFPKTTNLNIGVIPSDELNALCYPNGNIYITEALYERIKNDEELTFILAHEMAHYRHRDHLNNLRKSIASASVLMTMSILGPDTQNISKVVNSGMQMSDLKYSRKSEKNADKYAAKISIALYGSVDGGISIMKTLRNGKYIDFPEIFSSHPALDKRIMYLKQINKTNKKS